MRSAAPESGFDLAAYLSRIGLSSGGLNAGTITAPQLAMIHRAHTQSIPFENLDPHGGHPVSLQLGDLQAKLVTAGRGGYCFEQNLLLRAALEALGLEVRTYVARVRWGAPPGSVRGRTHLLLRVILDGRSWHADVGFGAATLSEPIPWGAGGPHEQAGWRFRVVRECELLVLQTEQDGAWSDMYAFELTPAPQVDLEVGNWFSCTHPRAVFVTGLTVSLHEPGGVRRLLRGWPEPELVVECPSGGTARSIAPGDVPELLERHFGLAGVGLDDAGRLMRPALMCPAASAP